MIDRSSTQDTPVGAMTLYEVVKLFGTCAAETILAALICAHPTEAGHMIASDPIKSLQNSLQGGGRPHMPQRRPSAMGDHTVGWRAVIEHRRRVLRIDDRDLEPGAGARDGKRHAGQPGTGDDDQSAFSAICPGWAAAPAKSSLARRAPVRCDLSDAD